MFSSVDELQLLSENLDSLFTFIFILGDGVYKSKKATVAQMEMLQCYYEVLIRLNVENNLNILSQDDINDLLYREDEIYRVNLSVSQK